jgi:ABC-type nitrate/sulfonate/bicarbonate transport system permease component
MLLARITVDFLRPIPSVALIPILVLVYGTSPSLKVALGAFGATFPLMFQAVYGVADVDPLAKDTARAFGLGWGSRLGRVVLPSCAPYLATGLRISASVALILVITGEYVVGLPGLGREVLIAQQSAAYDRMYALIMAGGLLGLVLNLGFHALERRVLFWHPSQRPVEAAA